MKRNGFVCVGGVILVIGVAAVCMVQRQLTVQDRTMTQGRELLKEQGQAMARVEQQTATSLQQQVNRQKQRLEKLGLHIEKGGKVRPTPRCLAALRAKLARVNVDGEACLAQVVDKARSPSPSAGDPVKATDRTIGKVLLWCVQAGMTPDQVTKVFGRPDTVEVRGLGKVTNVTYSYITRYGVTVSFSNPPHLPIDQADRVDGAIQ